MHENENFEPSRSRSYRIQWLDSRIIVQQALQISNFRNFAEVDIEIGDEDFWDGLTELEDGVPRPLDRGSWIGVSLKHETEVAA